MDSKNTVEPTDPAEGADATPTPATAWAGLATPTSTPANSSERTLGQAGDASPVTDATATVRIWARVSVINPPSRQPAVENIALISGAEADTVPAGGVISDQSTVYPLTAATVPAN